MRRRCFLANVERGYLIRGGYLEVRVGHACFGVHHVDSRDDVFGDDSNDRQREAVRVVVLDATIERVAVQRSHDDEVVAVIEALDVSRRVFVVVRFIHPSQQVDFFLGRLDVLRDRLNDLL